MPLTPADEKQFSDCFEMFDEEGEGEINVCEINRIMTLLGWDPTKNEIDHVVKAAKLRFLGKMTKEEFLFLMDIWCVNHKEKLTDEDLRKAFGIFDSDGSGYIERKELSLVLQGCGEEPLTTEEFDQMMCEADQDGDGKIDYKEFVDMLKGENQLLK